jgi:dolichol-phosphate mannosyltransferase
VYNEAGNVRPLLDEIRHALEGLLDYEVAYVDDGSTDATLEELRAAMVEDPRLVVVRHHTRCGQSAALRTGVQVARAPWIATLDGDGQNDPADIPGLFVQAHAGSRTPPEGMIAGHRVRRRDSFTRRWSSRLANTVRRAVLGDGAPDTGCGLKVFSRETYLGLPFFDHMHRFLPVLFRSQGAVVEVAEVHHRPRRSGRSKYGTFDRLWVGVVDLLGVRWLQARSVRPHAEVLR